MKVSFNPDSILEESNPRQVRLNSKSTTANAPMLPKANMSHSQPLSYPADRVRPLVSYQMHDIKIEPFKGTVVDFPL